MESTYIAMGFLSQNLGRTRSPVNRARFGKQLERAKRFLRVLSPSLIDISNDEFDSATGFSSGTALFYEAIHSITDVAVKAGMSRRNAMKSASRLATSAGMDDDGKRNRFVRSQSRARL